MALISAERYLAMKHPFAHNSLATEACLLVASASAWLLSVILSTPLAFDKTVFLRINNTFISLSIAFIVFCHVTVYRETRRHEQQIAAQQVTQEAREQFQNNKKALKLTSIILAVILLCYIPSVVYRITLLRYRSEMSIETVYLLNSATISVALLNSLLNAVIYTVRMRHLRIAFIEMRVFGAPNAVTRLEPERELEGQNQQNVEQTNGNNSDNHDIDVPPQQENCVVELLSNIEF